MNILIFVISLLLLVSAITYARLDQFFKTHLQAKEWQIMMQESERSGLNTLLQKCPIKKMTSDSANPVDPKKKVLNVKTGIQKDTGFGKLSYAWFMDKGFQLKNQDSYEIILQITKKLIRYLYADQKFFQRIEKERPDFLDQLFYEIRFIVETQTDEKNKMKNFTDLLHKHWRDPELKSIFGYFLQEGLIYNRSQKYGESDFDSEDDYEPYHLSRRNFQSLKDYFHEKQNVKLRVHLASRNLLTVLYEDPKIVDRIISARERLYREVRAGKAPEVATEEFQKEFSLPLYDHILDFQVTKTDPRNR